jgi:hypothetical protein
MIFFELITTKKDVYMIENPDNTSKEREMK